ncbi:MAG: 1,4-alpha-glucan branching protein GlgB [Lachnospiraceae bacterium]|nr:1,4-alpha-glucan branching protein GlgB [Lachnospiraceae bacterium]
MDSKLYKLMYWPTIEEIIYSESDDPHALLGPHKSGNSTLVQCFFPGAVRVTLTLVETEQAYEMEIADQDGYFAVLIPEKKIGLYYYTAYREDGTKAIYKDAYRHEPVITKEDTEKFNAGIHYTIYEKLGAHPYVLDGEAGTLFAVWAPNAVRVSVVGDFNLWDGRIHQMRRLWDSGIFELFIPDAKPGDNYKFELKVKGGLTYLKADPYGNAAQLRPDTASVIADITSFKWEDKKFIEGRKEFQTGNVPMSVYELYLGSFVAPGDERPYANYRQIADKLIPYVKEMGYTHVELMPVMEHPFDGSWGYQVIGYYAPTARYGEPEDFMYFVNELHKAGIGVILDWVPAHFPRDTHGLSNFDGTCLYEHLDPRKGSHPHWGTLIYNYGRPEVSNYLIANALFWVEKYHVDGIRMDAVASMLYLDYGKNDGEWVANIYGGNENLEAIEFIKHLNSIMKKRNPGVLSIAEESTAFPKITGDLDDDGLGFDLKWNMGFMNDYLEYIKTDPYFRSGRHGELTFSMIYAYSEKFMLVFSHDEVVHGKATMIGKMPGTLEEKFAGLKLTYAYMMTHPGKKALFMGQDVAEFDEFNEARTLQWELYKEPAHKGVADCYKQLNELYRKEEALYALDDSPKGFAWLNCISGNDCYLSYMRKGIWEDDILVVVANFAGKEQTIRTGVPYEGKYKEIFNTDDVKFGGSGVVNSRVKKAEDIVWDAKDQSIEVRLAPLSLSILRFVPYTEEELEKVIAERIRKKTIIKKEKTVKKGAKK